MTGVNVYPNPATDVINVKGLDVPTEALIVNIAGSIVSSSIISGSDATIDVSGLSTGVYFLLYNNAKVKFIKQ